VLVDSVRPVEVNPGDGERALAEVERAGATLVSRSGSSPDAAGAAVAEGSR
jgi:hypothetical protein